LCGGLARASPRGEPRKVLLSGRLQPYSQTFFLLLTNIKLDWKGFTGTHAIAYLALS
jgi:hypothetical protein